MNPSAPTEPLAPRVSVIFVTYNQAEALRRSITALLASRGAEKIEILTADCGSQDDSPRIDTEFPTVNVMRMPHHVGATRAMNIATRTAKADLVFYLSPQVEVTADTVATLADRLDSNLNDAAVCPLLLDDGGQPVPHVYALPDVASLTAAARGASLAPASFDASQESVAVPYATCDALMVRKAFIRGMNFFDQRYGHHWADLDLAMQVRRASKSIELCPSIRATRHAAPDPLAGEPLATPDRILGAAEFMGKYGMGGSGLRIGATLGALGKFQFGLFSALLSGQKIDGTQAGV